MKTKGPLIGLRNLATQSQAVIGVAWMLLEFTKYFVQYILV
jgi:hypothetical protein